MLDCCGFVCVPFAFFLLFLLFITLYEDNKAAILFSDHPGDHRRTKHMDTRKYFLRDAVINGKIKLEYINKTEQLADGLAKALTPDHHLQGVRGLLSSYQMSKT